MQLEYPGTDPVRPLKKNNFGPRLGVVYRLTDKTILSSGYGLVWIEMAGITTPFTTPTFPFLQTVSQRALDTISPAFVLQNGPSVAPIAPTPTAGLGQGVFAVDGTLGSGYVQQWNASLQRELTTNTIVEVAYVGIEHHARRHPGHEPQSVDGRTARAWIGVARSGCRIRSSASSRDRRRWAIRRSPVAQLLKPYPAYTTVSLYRNNVGTTRYQGFEVSLRRRFARGLSYSAAYTRSKLVDDASSVFDASILTGPIANYPVADSFNRRARAGLLDRRHSAHLRLVAGVGPAGGRRPRPAAERCARSDRQRLDGVVDRHAAVGRAGRGDAGDQLQRVRRFRRAAAESRRRSGAARRRATPSQWFNTAAFAVAPQFTLGSASRNPVRGPSYRNVDLALMRRIPVDVGLSIEVRAEVFNLLNTPTWAHRPASWARPTSARSRRPAIRASCSSR